MGWLVFLVVLATLRNRMDRIRLLLQAFCLNSVVVTLVGIGEIVNWGWAEKFISVFRTGRFFLGDAVRLSATLEYPNTTAVFLTQAVLLAVFLSLAAEKDQWPSLRRFGILLWIVVFLIAAVGLILTYSRGGWLEVVAGLAAGILLCWWSKEKQWAVRLTIVFAALMLLYLSMAYYSPYLRLRGLSFEPLPFFRVEYELDEKSLILKPGQEYSLQMVLHNRGLMPLEASGDDPYLFTYLWFDASGDRIVAEREILTPLPRDLLPDSSLKVEARFRAPDAEGEYVLLWDFFQNKKGWLSVRGIDRKMLPCRVYTLPPSEEALAASLTSAHHFIRSRDAGKRDQTQYLSRKALWKTAWKIFTEHPFTGIGGGNFRLVYWQYLGLNYWDERTHANSLYLEFLADTRLVGTTLLILFLGAVAGTGLQAVRRATDRQVKLFSLALLAALVGWLAHSTLDYFLEFTPTYLLFWIWAGVLAALRGTATSTSTFTSTDGQ